MPNGYIREMLVRGQFPERVDESRLKSISSVLILWALDGKHHGDGFGFPFDQPHRIFYQHVKTVNETLETLNHLKGTSLNPVLKLPHDLQRLFKMAPVRRFSRVCFTKLNCLMAPFQTGLLFTSQTRNY